MFTRRDAMAALCIALLCAAGREARADTVDLFSVSASLNDGNVTGLPSLDNVNLTGMLSIDVTSGTVVSAMVNVLNPNGAADTLPYETVAGIAPDSGNVGTDVSLHNLASGTLRLELFDPNNAPVSGDQTLQDIVGTPKPVTIVSADTLLSGDAGLVTGTGVKLSYSLPSGTNGTLTLISSTTTAPEPGGLLLCGMGLIGVSLADRKRNRAKTANCAGKEV